MSPDQIRSQVYAVIAEQADVPVISLNDGLKLFLDLEIGAEPIGRGELLELWDRLQHQLGLRAESTDLPKDDDISSITVGGAVRFFQELAQRVSA